MTTKVIDVPYGDHFTQHETWTVLSTSDTAIKCILRAQNETLFSKSTFFEGRIRSRAKDEIIAYFQFWIKSVRERGLDQPNEKPFMLQIN